MCGMKNLDSYLSNIKISFNFAKKLTNKGSKSEKKWIRKSNQDPYKDMIEIKRRNQILFEPQKKLNSKSKSKLKSLA